VLDHPPPPFDDASIVARLRANDADAFSMVYRHYVPRLLRYAVSIVGTVPDAEDIVAAVFLWIWESRATWSPGTSVRAYFYTAVHHRAINLLRDRARRDRLDTPGDSVDGALAMGMPPAPADEQLDLAARVEALHHAIAALPDTQRRVMTLRWQHGLAVREIADILQLSVAAVEKHVTRGLHAVRAALAGSPD